MKGSRRRRAHERIRISLLCGLIVLVAGEWLFLQPDASTPASVGTTAAVSASAMRPVVNVAASPDAYSSIVTNDLFVASREPPPGSVARIAAAQDEAQGSSLEVLGIITDGASRVALIEVSDGAEPVQARVGDSIAGSIVLQIMPAYVVLESNGLQRILSVQHEGEIAAGLSQVATTASPGAPSQVLSPPAPGSDQAPGQAFVDGYLSTRQLNTSAQDPYVPPASSNTN